jgi:hypothetical protein
VRVILNCGTFSSTKGYESTAGTADVLWLACGIDVFAVPFRGFVTAGNVGLAGVIRNFAIHLDELVSTSVASSMTTTSGTCTAIQYMLDGEIDVISFTVSGDLDTIGER